MSREIVWSMYEAIILIWEQNPVTGAKVIEGGPIPYLVNPRLVRGLAIAGNREFLLVLQPGGDPEEHPNLDDLILDIEHFFQEEDKQFMKAPLFERAKDWGGVTYTKRFWIEILYSNKREHLKDEKIILKKCFARLPNLSSSESPAATTGYSLQFRVFDFDSEQVTP